ncbi:hypothetical protein [Methylobacterium sp. WL120]|uniref:hypothetical protein n=1 Tax=Methylobacterium sp. WL120 TaxID=2603887 RepID=UPI0011CB09CF|nr:hypothetical protein [Methylobacterium sp. WL120]TXM69642.1 hypothetical protein FV229_04675 [Methylobacterium sp. WL120]
MNEFSVTITKTLSPSKIADQVITAIEGGIGYWCEAVDVMEPDRSTLTEKPWYADPKLYAGPFSIKFTELEEHKAGAGRDRYLTPANVQSGLNTMSEKYQDHFRDLVDENGDSDTADVFIQCCLFGDLIYG